MCEHYELLLLDNESVCDNNASSLPPSASDALPKNVCPTQCAICGDTSAGYHFEVPSCNGCKNFFRRTVLDQKNFACKNDGKCKSGMSKETRHGCRACRFDLCVEAGMNPLAIAAEIKPEKNAVIREILSKRKRQQQCLEQPSTSHAPVKLVVTPRVVENTIGRLIDELLHLEIAYDRIRKSAFTPRQRQGLTIDDCISGHSKLGIDYGEAPPDPRHKQPSQFVPLEVRIRERIPFPYKMKRRDNSPGRYPKRKVWDYCDLVYAIEYLKTFTFFHKLPETDKKVLARNVTQMTVFLSNSFYAFENKSDFTVYPDGAIPHGGQIIQWAGSKEARHDLEVHYETVQRVKRLNLDKKEYVLIKALVTCNPALEDLSTCSREVMQQQRDRYAKSLMSYVTARRGVVQGPSTYAEIMAHVDWLTRLVKRNKDIHVLIRALGLRNPKTSPLEDEMCEG